MGPTSSLLLRSGLLATALALIILPFASITAFSAINNYTWTKRTAAGARTWQHITSSNDGKLLATSEYGGSIWTSADSGATWTERTGAGTRNWRPIASSADGVKLVAGAWTGSNIWTSSDAGATWTERTSSGSRNWASITSSDDGIKLAAAAYSGSIWTSADSGATWTERTGAGSVHSIDSNADGTKLVAAGVTKVWTSADSGATWTEHIPTAGLHMWQVVASNANGTKLAAAENSGSIWTSADSGATWTERTGAGAKKWRTIASSADGNTLAAGDSGSGNNITISTDAGASWATQTDAGSHTWISIAMGADGNTLAATEDGDGGIWTAHIPEDPPAEPPTGTTLVTLHNAVDNAPVTVSTASGTNITCSSTHTEDSLSVKDPGYVYPLGLVRFCFTTTSANTQVTVTFATSLKPAEVVPRHFNAATTTYTTLADAVVSQTSLDGKHALQITYTIADNGPLDENTAIGSVTDPIGLAVMVGAPNTGVSSSSAGSPPPQTMIIGLVSILSSYLYRVLRKTYGSTRLKLSN